MNPKISVIVIGYNIQDYIENCIESILFQSFNDYETIFVNDGSKDNTLNVVKKYKNRIKIVDKSNGGIVSARKAGLRIAQGDYITFVDGDDWLNVDFLKNLCYPILSGADIDIICSDYFRQDTDGSFVNSRCHSTSENTCSNYEFYNGIMIEKIDHHMFPKLYKRKFVLDAGYLDYPEVTMAEDWLTNAFFGLFKPKVFFSNTVNYFYRFNSNSVSRKGGKKLLEQIKTLNYMERHFKEKCNFDFSKEMEFIWFAYTRTYVLENTETSIKRIILDTFKKKNIDYKKNEFCISAINQLGKKARLKLVAEIKMPLLVSVIDYLYDKVKSIRIQYKERKDIKFEKSMELLYDSYIDKLKQVKNHKKIYVIGTSDRSNIGDHIIAYSEISILNEVFPRHSVMEITGDTFRKRRKGVKDIIKKEDILFITGGGFLGDLWSNEEYMVNAVLKDYPDNKIIILPQTIYFYDEADSPILRSKLANYLKHKKLYLAARDKKTFEFYLRYFNATKIGLFPDMALYLNEKIYSNSSNDVMLCFREDKERVITRSEELLIVKILNDKGLNVVFGSTLGTGVHNGDIVLANRKRAIQSKLEEFARPKFIITDRLHGMILSTLAGTPCIVFDNLSKKVTEVHDQWMNDIKSVFICNDIKSIDEQICAILNIKHFQYSPDYLNNKKEEFVSFIKEAVEK